MIKDFLLGAKIFIIVAVSIFGISGLIVLTLPYSFYTLLVCAFVFISINIGEDIRKNKYKGDL